MQAQACGSKREIVARSVPAKRSESRRPYDLDRLTDIALRVFAERGYDGASMDDVARAAGITKASIYHHVAGKEALLERGLGRALDALFAVLERPEARAERAIERLEFIVGAVAELTAALLPELTVLFRVRGNSAIERAAQARRRAFDRHVGETIEHAQREGDLRSDVDPMLAARLLFGMSNSIVEWFRPSGRLSKAELALAIRKVALDGLRAR